jgi:hypothetical protein
LLPRRKSLRAILLPAVALAAGLVIACKGAAAQGVGVSDLMRPALDGNPRDPPRFRRTTNPAGTDPSQFGALPKYDAKQAIGTGSTGFDSSGVPRKIRNAKKTAPGAAGMTAAAAAASGKPVVLIPDPPPMLTAAEAARLRIVQTRRGAIQVDPALLAANVGVPQLRRVPLIEERPFAPTGILVGSFLLRPALEITRGYDTNPARAAPSVGSWLWTYAPELLVNSNWARHELTATVKGAYYSYDTQHQLDRPNMDARINGRIDVTSLTRMELEGRWLVATDSPGSPNIQANLLRLPVYTTFGTSIGVGQQVNRLDFLLKAGVDRTVYQDSHFDNGAVQSNIDRNLDQYAVLLRTSYDLLPGLRPFVEAGGDQRKYQVLPDLYGEYRNSQGWRVKAGSTFTLSAKLTGEASVGYLSRSYLDPNLAVLSGATLDAALVWVASALTTVKLTATTTANETTVQGVSGIFTREVALQVDHAFRRWLIGTVRFARALDVYEGSPRVDYRYAGSAMLTYMLSREWQLKAEYRREWRISNTAGDDYLANVFLVGVRLQR